MESWPERDVAMVVPAGAFTDRQPRFRGGYAASAGSAGDRPARIVFWRQDRMKAVVVGLVGVRWDAPRPGLVTVERVRWPPGGIEAHVRAAILALSRGQPVPPPASVRRKRRTPPHE